MAETRGVVSAGRGAGPARILIVEGYVHSREGLTTSLASDGLGVEPAAECGEALRKMRDGHFDLAIIDVDLRSTRDADLNGWDVARMFRALHPGAAVILVTAEWRPELGTAAARLRDCCLIEKPINPAELRSMVRALQSDAGG